MLPRKRRATPEQHGHLKVSCPHCGKKLCASTLLGALAAARACCESPRVKHTPVSINRPPPPDAPLTWHLPRKILSQNKTTYAHWTTYRRDKRGWVSCMRPLMANMLGLRLYYSVWQVTRVYSGRSREFDHGNLVGGCKPLIDVLVSAAVIQDDAPRHFSCAYHQKHGDRNETILELLEYIYDQPSN